MSFFTSLLHTLMKSIFSNCLIFGGLLFNRLFNRKVQSASRFLNLTLSLPPFSNASKNLAAACRPDEQTFECANDTKAIFRMVQLMQPWLHSIFHYSIVWQKGPWPYKANLKEGFVSMISSVFFFFFHTSFPWRPVSPCRHCMYF